jgi:hypothetical protein
MTRTLLATVLLAGATVVAVGCSANNTREPYSLTGQSQAQIDQQHQEWAVKQHYTDDKGRYHPELAEWNTAVK